MLLLDADAVDDADGDGDVDGDGDEAVPVPVPVEELDKLIVMPEPRRYCVMLQQGVL